MNLRARLGKLEAITQANRRPFAALTDDALDAEILATLCQRAGELGRPELVEDDGRLIAGGILALAAAEPDAELALALRERHDAIRYTSELAYYEHPRNNAKEI